MARNNPEKFRKDYASDLRLFGDVIARERDGTFQDTSPLISAASDCIDNTPIGSNSWGYDLNRLLLRIETPKHTLPSTVGNYLNLELSVSLQGECSFEPWDPFKKLNIDIVIRSIEGQTSYICQWHLDKDISGERNNNPDNVHPLYHFQYGGMMMKSLVGNTGKVLLLDPPRVAYPPMDGLLAIDFVLANFANNLWRKLRRKGEYRNRIVKYQDMFWSDYFKSIVKHLDTSTVWGDQDVFNLWPLLICP